MILDVNLDCGHKRLSKALDSFLVPLERSKCMLSKIPSIEVRTVVSYFWVWVYGCRFFIDLGLGLG